VTLRIINIIGDAINIGEQPALAAENIGIYYIQGMDKWQDEWLDKKVKLIGELRTGSNSKLNVIIKPVCCKCK
jgi:hypothetical protein